ASPSSKPPTTATTPSPPLSPPSAPSAPPPPSGSAAGNAPKPPPDTTPWPLPPSVAERSRSRTSPADIKRRSPRCDSRTTPAASPPTPPVELLRVDPAVDYGPRAEQASRERHGDMRYGDIDGFGHYGVLHEDATGLLCHD